MANCTLTLGYSPCPNDCFIFDALVHQKIDTEGLTFEPYISDVEDLNLKAKQADLDITKLSFNAFAQVIEQYALLDAGAALGKGCGPLVISKKHIETTALNTADFKVGIPGRMTTANLLFSIAFPNATHKVEYVFSAIEDALLDEAIDAGVIIHENRFTYADKGLLKVIDLGDYWEKTTGHPIPLGGIAIKRRFETDLQLKVERLIRKSVEFAFANPASSLAYVKAHAQEMDEKVMQQHIDLYVNAYSLNLGEQGRNAIQALFKKGGEAGFFKLKDVSIFINN